MGMILCFSNDEAPQVAAKRIVNAVEPVGAPGNTKTAFSDKYIDQLITAIQYELANRQKGRYAQDDIYLYSRIRIYNQKG